MAAGWRQWQIDRRERDGIHDKSRNAFQTLDTESQKVSGRCCFTSAAFGQAGIWPVGVSEGRVGADWKNWLFCFFCALLKCEGSMFPLLLTVEQGLGSSRIGEGVSWQKGVGSIGSGDPNGVRKGEPVDFVLSAAVRVENKHRCSNSWPQKLDTRRSIYTCFSTYQFAAKRSESNRPFI